MITTDERAIALKPLYNPSSVPYSSDLNGNEAKSFVIKGYQLTCNRLLSVETECSGKFYDRQRLDETKGRLGCACFSHKSTRSPIVVVYYMVFTTQTG